MKEKKPSIWDIISSIMALVAVVVSVIFGVRDYRLNKRMLELEETANAIAVAAEERAIVEDILIDMTTGDLQVFMVDSAACYETKFKNVISDPWDRHIEFRVPVTIHLLNNSEKQVIIRWAQLFYQSSSSRRMSAPKEFAGIIKKGQAENFSIPANDIYTIEADVRFPVNDPEFWDFLDTSVAGYSFTSDGDFVPEFGADYTCNPKVDDFFRSAFASFWNKNESYYILNCIFDTARNNRFSCSNRQFFKASNP